MAGHLPRRNGNIDFGYHTGNQGLTDWNFSGSVKHFIVTYLTKINGLDYVSVKDWYIQSRLMHREIEGCF